MKPNKQFLLSHPAHFIALGFGAGLAPIAPGTWGTLVALPIFLLTQWASQLAHLPWLLWLVALILFVLGIYVSDKTGSALGVSDHGGIVIDEIAAFFLVLMFTPSTWLWMLLAFVLFRLFDIWKPWPISYFDRTLKGGFGVMFDDLLAALFSIAAIWLIGQFGNIGGGFGQ